MSTLAKSADFEIWRRTQDHKEASLVVGAAEGDRLLVSLVLALARLAAQREIQRKVDVIAQCR